LTDGGVVAESENAIAMANAAEGLATLPLEQLLAMGQRAQRYYQDHLALSVGVAGFGTIFKQLISKVQSK
jgi:colanic acid biosynthesis glycosyl transferase WcaI